MKERHVEADKTIYNARLVAKGYAQKGIDLNKIFSHILKTTSIWVLLHTTAYYDLELKQLDVIIAFLQGEENYMNQAEGS